MGIELSALLNIFKTLTDLRSLYLRTEKKDVHKIITFDVFRDNVLEKVF